jgi:hypothetical protein
VITAVSEKHPVIGADPQPVRRREESLTPGAEEAALTVEDQHGGLGQAVEEVDLVSRVNPNGGDQT